MRVSNCAFHRFPHIVLFLAGQRSTEEEGGTQEANGGAASASGGGKSGSGREEAWEGTETSKPGGGQWRVCDRPALGGYTQGGLQAEEKIDCSDSRRVKLRLSNYLLTNPRLLVKV